MTRTITRRAALGAAGGALALSATTLPAQAASDPLRAKCELLVDHFRNLPGSTIWGEYVQAQRIADHLESAMGRDVKPYRPNYGGLDVETKLAEIDQAMGGKP